MYGDEKVELLRQFAKRIERACLMGQVVRRRSVQLQRAVMSRGLRAGCVDLFAGMETDRVFSALSRSDAAMVRPLVPAGWSFAGSPSVSLVGRAIRIEVAWPEHLAVTRVPLSRLKIPSSTGAATAPLRWMVGLSQFGHVAEGLVTLGDEAPHALVCGTTGAGKSVVQEALIAQMAQREDVRMVVIDGKGSKHIAHVANARGMVGPVARDSVSIRAALQWAVREMQQRYGGARDTRAVLIVIDELWNIVQDEKAKALLTLLLSQGREARCFVVAATQYPTVDAIGGPQAARNFVMRIAMHVPDLAASYVATGLQNANAHRLMMKGDALKVMLGGDMVRLQTAYADNLDRLPRARPEFEEWPDEEAAMDMPSRFEAEHVAHAIISASQSNGEGRRRLLTRLLDAGLKKYSSEKMQALAEFGRQVLTEMKRNGWSVGALQPESGVA